MASNDDAEDRRFWLSKGEYVISMRSRAYDDAMLAARRARLPRRRFHWLRRWLRGV